MTFLHLFFWTSKRASQLGLLDISRLLVKTTIYLGIPTFSNITIGSLADFQFCIFSMDNHATSLKCETGGNLKFDLFPLSLKEDLRSGFWHNSKLLT